MNADRENQKQVLCETESLDGLQKEVHAMLDEVLG